MEAYTNCREFNCVTPIMEQSEYHMFCRERAELYLPEMYNKIGVGMMAWGPLGMYLTDNQERLFFSKGSLRSKTQNSSWTEDELAKEVGWRETENFSRLTFLFSLFFPLAKIRIASRRPKDIWRKFVT
jgi:aryl-alcohol dehydrogenase-like predicted oxidoreductase